MCVSFVNYMCTILGVIHIASCKYLDGMDKSINVHILSFYNSHFNHSMIVFVFTAIKVKNQFIHKIHNPYYNYHKINLVQY